jgi:hypothetical protein
VIRREKTLKTGAVCFLALSSPIAQIMNPSIEDRIRSARSHLELGRAIIGYYKELLERHRAEGRDTKSTEDLLEALERS